MWFFRCNLGNISTGASWLPMAYTATAVVTFIPPFPEVTPHLLDSLSTDNFGRDVNG
jgi:hypothetical protein